MKQLVIRAIIKMCGKAVLLTTIMGVVIGIIGNMNKWNSSIAYSNAFFIAGCLVFVAGAMSRYAASQHINDFQLLYVESFRDMSSSERAKFIIDASSSVSTVILGILTGFLLILISAFVAKMF